METISKKVTNQFGSAQLEALRKGATLRERMVLLISNITNIRNDDKYNSLYIYSPPGLGKTYTVNEFLQRSQMNYVPVTGNTSLFAFGIQLAVIRFINRDNSPVIVHVDDCDEIFKNEQNCNTMKKILDEDKKFVYEKSLNSQINNMTELQRAAIQFFGDDGRMGFEVPTENMRFIFTSNFQLPNDDEVSEARRKSKSKAILMSHRNAIRSRCKVADFNLTKEEHWGWLADVILNTNCLSNREVSNDDRITILDFLWYNWSNLNERSIRLIEKMVITMDMFPNSYKTVWEIDHLKNPMI